MSDTTKILVVEDEPIQLEILIHNFKRAGECEVLQASNAEDALAIAIREQPSLILSDYFLPGMNGIDLCKKVKANPELRGTIFVILTSAGDSNSKIFGLNSGADDYLAKPVQFEELNSRIRALLRIRVLQNELADDKRELEKLNIELQEDFNGIIGLLMKVLALRAPDAVARAEQASAICEWIATRLELDENAKRTLSLAGRLKEIGKISLPDELLRKSRVEYTTSDFDVYERYAVLGQLLVGDIPQLKDVALLLRHQNENYDGSGYPDRLNGVQIPLGSRILRAINVMQGLWEKNAASVTSVRDRLMDAIGTLLEPKVGLLVEEFIRVESDPSWKDGKRSVRIEELEAGMVLAGDLITGRGMMLLSKDSKLSQSQIDHLHSMSHFDPIIHDIYVYDTPV
jgi:response regulator RpfG family c-di-GMP phosphodiesterase